MIMVLVCVLLWFGNCGFYPYPLGLFHWHWGSNYSNVIMGVMASQITSLTIVYSTIYIQAQIKENIKVLRHWPLCGEFTGEFPTPKTSNVENVSI